MTEGLDLDLLQPPTEDSLDLDLLQPPMTLGEVGSQALENLVPSAIQFGKDVIQPVIHPIETLDGLKNIIVGTVQKAIPGDQEKEAYADAVGQFFVERYGGVENIKKTIAEDPVGFGADVFTVVSLGAGLPGKVGTVAKVTKRASGAPIRGAGHLAAEVAGFTSGAGGQSVKTAFNAAAEGGAAQKALRSGLRGGIEAQEVVDDALAALGNIRKERGAAYVSGIADLTQDTTVLFFSPITNGVNKLSKITQFKGQKLSSSAERVRTKIQQAVETWERLDPQEFHTPAGLDALKKQIGEIKGKTRPGTADRLVADNAYNVVRDQIVKQSPKYAQTMDKYSEATGLIKQMEKTLSLNPNAQLDTQIRKLQSVLKDNVVSQYGQRVALTHMLREHGATQLLEKLSGDALKNIMPKRDIASMGSLLGIGTASYFNPLALAALPLESPRAVGEAAVIAGKATRVARPVAKGILPAFQAGRLTEE